MDFTLKYHYRPEKGWINDPNGLVCFKGWYHLFYQHAPHFEEPWKEPMCWGHARTKDFRHWEELPVALWPDMPYDQGGVWSGTAVEEDGKLYLFYASVEDGHQRISAAVSEDGETFVKYAGNPIIRDFPADGSNDFRDPAIFVENGRRYLVIASADPAKKTGNLLLYEGSDMFHWDYKGVLIEYPECKFCECPSFVKHGDGYLLSTSVVRLDESHYFEVLYGQFDGQRFIPETVSHFQKGPDEYAGQIFHDTKDRNLLISWIPGWKYAGAKEKSLGCLSLPLEITLRDGKLRGYPAEEVRELLSKDGSLTDNYVRETFINGGEEVRVEVLL